MTVGSSDRGGDNLFASQMKVHLAACGWRFTNIVNTPDNQVWTDVLSRGPVHMVWVNGRDYPESVSVRLYMATEEECASVQRVLEAATSSTIGIVVKKKKTKVTKKEGHEYCNIALEVVMDRAAMTTVSADSDPTVLARFFGTLVRLAHEDGTAGETPAPSV